MIIKSVAVGGTKRGKLLKFHVPMNLFLAQSPIWSFLVSWVETFWCDFMANNKSLNKNSH